MKRILLLCLLTTSVAADVPPPGERDGEIHPHAESFLAWDAVGEQWLSPDDFWAAFAARERGRNWGVSDRFPTYADVSEHDSIVIETEDGACLMYFFHRRWRRGNDVWRWNPIFNDYSGCPTVFEKT